CPLFFFFSSRRRHTRFSRDWSSDVCSSDLPVESCSLFIPLAHQRAVHRTDERVCTTDSRGGQLAVVVCRKRVIHYHLPYFGYLHLHQNEDTAGSHVGLPDGDVATYGQDRKSVADRRGE